MTDTSRRRVLNWLLSLGSGGLLATLLYPILRYVTPPEEGEATTSSVVAGKARDFPPNTGKIVRFGERPVLVVHLPGGEFRAFSAVCTHLNCTVRYRTDLERIWCACHNGMFDLSGRNVSGPPPRPLDALDATVRGDDIIVSRRS